MREGFSPDIMMRSIITPALSLLMVSLLHCAHAAVVHKWIDADGVTHYSDKAPGPAVTDVSMIDVPSGNSDKTDVKNGYYSIKNQWQRVHKERLEQQKLELERDRQKAVLQSTTPPVVYVDESAEERYAVAYLGRFHHRYRHGRLHKKQKRHRGFTGKRYSRGKAPIGLHAGRLKLGSYRLSQ